MSVADELAAAVEAWLAVDPDPATRAELEALVAADDDDALAERFSGTLQFGTAGLRGALGAGPMRMNRVVVRRAAWGLVCHVLATDPTAAGRGLLIGCDARTNSDVFARDTARVAAALGMRARLLPDRVPTPLLASSITSYGAAAGVMVTASHNPPQDNGYKVYLDSGAQIVAPVDQAIAGWIERAPAAVPLAEPDDPLIEQLTAEPVERYLAGLPVGAPIEDLRIAYSPLHGVAGQMLVEAFERTGLPSPTVVAEQFEPDPGFPTIAFPNPEEPGTMDLLLALAERIDAHLAIANDPDGDRVGAAIPTAAGGWRLLTGDELGCLLADHVLATTTGDDRLVVTTRVSSTLLSKLAAAAGVHYAETNTGFKWIARAVLDHPQWRFVFGYEQALGYLVAPRPLDKDGISAAVMLARLTAETVAAGGTIERRLDEIAARFGRHVTVERSVRLAPADGVRAVAALRADPPAELAGVAVSAAVWFEDAGLLRLECGPTMRVQVRPSGTEPKVKIYGEAIDGSPSAAVDALAELLAGRA